MIVVQHVDAAEAGDSLLYHLFHRLLVAAVKIDGMRIFTDLSNDVLRAFQENVSDDDLCSFAREPFGGGAPNATPPPADHGYLSLRPQEHPSELKSLTRTPYAVFCPTQQNNTMLKTYKQLVRHYSIP